MKHTRVKMKFSKVKRKKEKGSRKKAGAPKSPLNWLGNPNRMWIKEKNLHSHATFVVDHNGTGTYCHSTVTYPGDRTKYHYGYEIRNRNNRDKGKFFWTTPYEDEYKFTRDIRAKLKRLYYELCDEDGTFGSLDSLSSYDDRRRDDDRPSSRYTRRSRSRSRSRRSPRSPRSPRRGGKKTKCRYKNR